MRYFSLIVPAILLVMSVEALAQGTTYHLGRTPTPEEIHAWDIAISPDGKGLPPGRGTAVEGAILYAEKCAKCHGQAGEQQFMGFSSPGTVLVRRTAPNSPPRPPSQPLATIYWDHINRAMPKYEEGSLSANEVYALTALLLYWYGVIQQGDVMDAQTLPKVQMPNRNAFIPAPSDLKQSMSCDPQLLRCVEYWKKMAEEKKK